MSLCSKRIAVFAAVIVSGGFAASALAQQGSSNPQVASRCGGLFCDLYYAHNPPGQASAGQASSGQAPGQPAGQSSSIFLPCHDFVCGMFGGRTPDQPVAVATEPEPAPAEPAPKAKHKRVAKHVAKDSAKPAMPAVPAAQ